MLPGDTWPAIAKRTGIDVRSLQASNPQAVRANGWLRVGEKLAIPIPIDPKTGVAPAVLLYRVQPGDSWSSIAAQFGIRIILLQAVNAESVRQADVLRIGEEILIPPPPPPPGAQLPRAAQPAGQRGGRIRSNRIDGGRPYTGVPTGDRRRCRRDLPTQPTQPLTHGSC